MQNSTLDTQALSTKWLNSTQFSLVDTYFDKGANFLATLTLWRSSYQRPSLMYYYAIEETPISQQALQTHYAQHHNVTHDSQALLAQYPPLLDGFHSLIFKQNNDEFRLILCFQSLQKTLSQLPQSIDYWHHLPSSTHSPLTYPWFSLNSLSLPPKKKRSVSIIGAGIAGCQIAWHLAKRGYAITLIERHSQPAQEGSGNLAGAIFPKMTAQPSIGEQFYQDCYLYVLKQLSTLQPLLDWHDCGVLQLCHNPQESKRWKSLSTRSLPPEYCQLLDALQADHMAGISFNRAASFFPKGGWVEPKAYCAALLKTIDINLIQQTTVANFKLKPNTKNSCWQTFDPQQQLISESDILIVATGRFTDWPFLSALPSQPVKGQTTLAQATKSSQPLKCVLGHAGYMIPSHPTSHQHVFGATFERNINNTQLSDLANRTNYQQCHDHIPQLAMHLGDLSHGHAAVRLGTPDRLPYVGAVPNIDAYQHDYAQLHHGQPWATYADASYQPNLFVSMGYGARGLTTSALCSEVLAQIINAEKPSVEQRFIHQIHPARFLIKAIKQQK